MVRAYPVASRSAAATVTTLVRKPSPTVARNAPAASAVVVTREVGSTTSVGVPATTTRAPGRGGAGDGHLVAVHGAAGDRDRQHAGRAVAHVAVGDRFRLLHRSARADPQGEPDELGLGPGQRGRRPGRPPRRKPIDAVSGGVPYGEAGRSGFSQACSGTRPTPEAEAFIAASSAVRGAPVAALQMVLGALAGEHRPEVPGAGVAGRPRLAVRRALGRVGHVAVAVAVLGAGRVGAVAVEAVPLGVVADHPVHHRQRARARPGRRPAGCRAGSAPGSPASTTARWSAAGPPLPRPYVIAASGSPVLDSRMK